MRSGNRPGCRTARAAARCRRASRRGRRARAAPIRTPSRRRLIDAFAEKRARHADAQPLDVAAQRVRSSRASAPATRSNRAGRSRRSPAKHAAPHLRRSCERTDLIERRGERQQAVARDAAVGRLEADDAAEPGGLPNRSAGVRAERERHHPRRHRRALIRRSIRQACASRPTDSSTGRARNSRSTSPSRTRRGWSCR